MRQGAPRKRRVAKPSCTHGTSRRNGTRIGHRHLEPGIMPGKRRRRGIGLPTFQSLKAITTAIRALVRSEALRRILVVCTTWEATYGNGAKIGTMLKRNTVCCAVRRGTITTATLCLLRFAPTSALMIVSMLSGFVVL